MAEKPGLVRSSAVVAWVTDRLLEPMKSMTAQERVHCALVGILGGVFPIPMLTTAITLALGKALHLSAAQLVVSTSINFVMTPLEVLLIPVLVQVGSLCVPSSLVGKTDAQALISDVTSGDSWGSAGQALLDLLMLACIPWLALSMMILSASLLFVSQTSSSKLKKC